MCDRQDESRTYDANQIGHDGYEGYYIDGECPNCGQDYSNIYLGTLCVECGVTFEISQIEVTWSDD